jgi:hypothetical protein
MKTLILLLVSLSIYASTDENIHIGAKILQATLTGHVTHETVISGAVSSKEKNPPSSFEVSLTKDNREILRVKTNSISGNFKIFKMLPKGIYQVKVVDQECDKSYTLDTRKQKSYTKTYFNCGKYKGYKSSKKFRSEILRKLDYIYNTLKKDDFQYIKKRPEKTKIEKWDQSFYTVAIKRKFGT